MLWALAAGALLVGAVALGWWMRSSLPAPVVTADPEPVARVDEDLEAPTPPTAPGRLTLPDDEVVLDALGLRGSLEPRGKTPVVVVPRAVFPGLRFGPDAPLQIDDETLKPAFERARSSGAEWVALVERRDASAQPSPDNLHRVGCLLKVDRWMEAGHGVSGHTVEPADLEFHDGAEGLEADYTVREWMPAVNECKTKIEALAGLMETERPEVPVSWLATHGMERVEATQTCLEQGPTALVEALDATVTR